ncbi:MAG TPA: N-acetylneuraminate synthase family protein [Gaiellaceae bacterium]|nr:N-acetylneuraminate synthase family protein [Gaiellaceae bacterium]
MSLLPDHVFVVCEAGVTNYGEPELAHAQVDAAADARCDAVKFQAWRTRNLVSAKVAERLSDELGRNWFERMASRELPYDELRRLQEHARERGLVYFATPHDEESLDFLVHELDVPWLKVGSGEASNWSFLERVGAAGKAVLVAFGLQSDDEAKRAVDLLGSAGAAEVVALHTVSVYPTPPELVGLRRMTALQDVLDVPVGLSDHTVGWHIPLAAVALGARAIEKHLTFDKTDERSLDNPGALEPAEFAAFVEQIRELERALAPPAERGEKDAGDWALQAVVAARELSAGDVLQERDVAFKRPGRGGVPASRVGELLGRTLRVDVPEDEQILLAHVD